MSTYTPDVSNFGFAGGSDLYKIQQFEMVGNAALNFIGSPMQQQENTFAQASRKVEEITAVTSIVIGDYNRTNAINAFNKMDFIKTGNATSDYLKSIGIHNDANNFNFNVNVSDATISAKRTISADKNTFTEDQLIILRQKGKLDISGTTYTVDKENLNHQIAKYRSSLSRNQSVLSATNNHAKSDAMKTLYSAALNDMKSSTSLQRIYDARNQGGSAVLRECAKAKENLNSQIKSIIDDKNNTALKSKLVETHINLNKPLNEKELNAAINIISSDKTLSGSDKNLLIESITDKNKVMNFEESGIALGGNIDNNRGILANGKNIVARNILGQDFYQGYKFYKTGIKVGSLATKTVVSLNTNLAYKTSIGLGDILEKHTPDSNLKNFITETNEFLKADKIQYDELKKIKDPKKRREKKRTNRRNRADERINKKIDKYRNDAAHDLSSKDARLQKKGNRRIKKADALEIRQKRRFKRQAGRDKYRKISNRIDNFSKKITNVVKKPFNFLMKPAQFILNGLEAIKKFLIKSIALPFALFIFKFIGLLGGLLMLVYLVAHFISANPAASFVNRLNSVNYVQLIADGVSQDLATNFMEVAKADATIHFLADAVDSVASGGAIKSKNAEADKVDADFTNGNITKNWYITPNYGEIGKIWVWEEADNRTKWATNANGHTQQELVYKEGFVNSDDYQGYISPRRRETVGSVTANIVPIISMMHHRYNDDITFDEYPTALGYAYYMFVQSHDLARYDNALKNSTIDDVHYTQRGYSYIYQNACERSGLYEAAPTWNGTSVTNRDKEKCTNIYVHGDNAGLSKAVAAAKSLGTVAASRNEALFKKTVYELYSEYGALDIFNAMVPAEGYYIIDSTVSNSPSSCSANASVNGGTLDTGSDGKCTNFKIFKYGDAYLKCDITGHGPACYDENNVLICTDPKHDDNHVHEFKETDDSCYVRVAVCQGHCGGHLTPQVNLVEKMTYEGLIMDDWFKTTHFLTKEEVLGQDLTDPLNLVTGLVQRHGINSITAWKTLWNARATLWFSPFPRSLWGFTKTVANISLNAIANIGYNDTADTSGKDIYEFDGWWKDVNIMDEEEVDLLCNIYGCYYKQKGSLGSDEKYKQALENWSEETIEKDYAVTFQTGAGQTLTETQIQEYMSMFRAMNLSESQLAILEDALRHVGAYYYSLTGSAHQNGINSDSGPSECSGFVSGVLSRALGRSFNNSAAGYASLGRTGITPQPGDIMAHSRSGSGSNGQSYTGHVVIYAGYMSNGPDGPGEYIIDCTSSGSGGSQLRKCNNCRTKYPKVYRP